MRSMTWNKIDVMAAYAKGKKIEVRHITGGEWELCDDPTWNWMDRQYRVYKVKQHSIDWSQVPDGFDWLYTDIDDAVKITNTEPRWFEPTDCWCNCILFKPKDTNTIDLNADLFSSFIAGDEETYKDIIARPKQP